VSGIKVKDCRHGRFMYYANDVYIGGSLDRYGEYSEGEIDLWRRLVRPGMTVLDVGANIGCFTVPLSRIVGDSGRVVAFEPQRQVYQMLVGNLALNEIANTNCMNAALGAAERTVSVPVPDYSSIGNFGDVQIQYGQSESVVPCLTVDAMFFGAPVHFIKIDVEGMECDVLEGARETISRDRPVVYVENDREGKSEELIQKILAFDYRLWWHLTPLFNPKNFSNDTADDFLRNIVAINMVGIHASSEVEFGGVTLKEIKSPQDKSGARLTH